MKELIDALKKNIETEVSMLQEISRYSERSESAAEEEKAMYSSATDSLRSEMKIINNSIPKLLANISLAQDLPGIESIKQTGIEKVVYAGASKTISIALNKKDKEKFLKELSLNESVIKKLKRREKIEEVKKPGEFKRSRGYFKIANRYFLNKAIELSKKDFFKSLGEDLKKGNFEILLETYISMMLFTTVLSVFAGIFIMIFFLFFNLGFDLPFVNIYQGSYLIRFAEVFWIIFIVPIATFLAVYIYPSTEKSSISSRIDEELPFAVIHMSAIAGSGIAPAEIFRIIGLGEEYPALAKEVVKILNQINLYGYDLSTALINSAKSASNSRLAELFLGLATTINSGGSLPEFFEKRSETLMLQYRLDKEKFAKLAETFMDIYISVVIATPMIMMLLLMMISITGTNTGLGPDEIGLLIIGAIALINVFFLVFLNLKQPKY